MEGGKGGSLVGFGVGWSDGTAAEGLWTGVDHVEHLDEVDGVDEVDRLLRFAPEDPVATTVHCVHPVLRPRSSTWSTRSCYAARVLVGILTAVTLIAFAANSLLCRMALGAELIDPVSFTTLRLVSGAAVLFPISRLYAASSEARAKDAGSWLSGLALFAYAISFSLAYIWLDTGMGALILFGAVQATMIGAGLWAGERPPLPAWLGLAAALGGLVYLVWPGITAPDRLGASLMAVAGMAWGVYSLRGRSAAAPVPATGGNFLRTVPMAVGASVLAFSFAEAERTGVILALVSGTLTSGLGYVVWYRALRGLTATRAAVVQLLVPVIAAFGGVVFLAERLSARLIVAGALILGGVLTAVVSRRSR